MKRSFASKTCKKLAEIRPYLPILRQLEKLILQICMPSCNFELRQCLRETILSAPGKWAFTSQKLAGEKNSPGIETEHEDV